MYSKKKKEYHSFQENLAFFILCIVVVLLASFWILYLLGFKFRLSKELEKLFDYLGYKKE